MAHTFFAQKITIPKNTQQPILMYSARVNASRVNTIFIDIPEGWQYTAGLIITIGDDITIPSKPAIIVNLNENLFPAITGNNTFFKFHIDREIHGDPIVAIYAYNTDTVNNHSCVVTIDFEV